MKRILLLSAAALLFSVTASIAKPRLTVIKLNETCDTFDVSISGTTAWALDAPSCAATYGGGLVGAVKGFGKSVILALHDPSQPGTQFVLELAYPFIQGGAYKLYSTNDGQSLMDALDGTYTVE
jgi:hypothetical protein